MASVLHEDGAAPSPPDPTTALSFDVSVFRQYLELLLPPGMRAVPLSLLLSSILTTVMSATQEELADSLFIDPSFEEKALRFATDVGCQVVYITRERFVDLEDGASSISTAVRGREIVLMSDAAPTTGLTYRLHLPPTPQHSPNTLSTLALIKSAPTLDSLNPLGSQLHFVQLSSSAVPQLVADDGTPSGASTVVTTPSAQATPYDGLHSLVHWGVAPWFDSYVSSKSGLLDGAAVSKKGGEAQMGRSYCPGDPCLIQVSPSPRKSSQSSSCRFCISNRTSRSPRSTSRCTLLFAKPLLR